MNARTARQNRIDTANRFIALSTMLHREARRIAFTNEDYRTDPMWKRFGTEGQRCGEVARNLIR